MARYRHGRRDFFLHGVIVALAAVTSSIWLARDEVEQIERFMPRPRFSFRSLLSARRPPPRPHLQNVETAEPESVRLEDPPAVAVTAPTLEPDHLLRLLLPQWKRSRRAATDSRRKRRLPHHLRLRPLPLQRRFPQ